MLYSTSVAIYSDNSSTPIVPKNNCFYVLSITDGRDSFATKITLVYENKTFVTSWDMKYFNRNCSFVGDIELDNKLLQLVL